MRGVQGMAGNIIHAIATTNAVIAGMIVIEAMKVLAGMPEACKVSWLLCSAESRLEWLMSRKSMMSPTLET